MSRLLLILIMIMVSVVHGEEYRKLWEKKTQKAEKEHDKVVKIIRNIISDYKLEKGVLQIFTLDIKKRDIDDDQDVEQIETMLSDLDQHLANLEEAAESMKRELIDESLDFEGAKAILVRNLPLFEVREKDRDLEEAFRDFKKIAKKKLKAKNKADKKYKDGIDERDIRDLKRQRVREVDSEDITELEMIGKEVEKLDIWDLVLRAIVTMEKKLKRDRRDLENLYGFLKAWSKDDGSDTRNLGSLEVRKMIANGAVRRIKMIRR